MTLLTTSSTITAAEKYACDVFVGCMPLSFPKFAPKSLPPSLANLGVLHYYTVVQEPSSETSVMYFDFLPVNPLDPLIAARVALGLRVPGVVRGKKLQRPPERSCWWVGKTKDRKGLLSANDFNRNWDSDMLLLQHDCRHYTDGLVEHLTGEKNAISKLRTHKSLEFDPGLNVEHF